MQLARLVRVRAHLNTQRRVSPQLRSKCVAGKGHDVIINATRATRRDDDAFSRLEARIPSPLPPLPFLRGDVDIFVVVVVVVVERRRRKDAQRDDGEAISIQFPYERYRERRFTKLVRSLKDANIRARGRRGICKDNRRFKSNSRE